MGDIRVVVRLRHSLVDHTRSLHKRRVLYSDGASEALNSAGWAEAAECARSEGKFWSMHERLFFHQPSLDRAALQTQAAAVGLSIREFDVCNAGVMRQRIRDDQAEALRLGVNGTPTFLIGRIEQSRVHLLRAIRGAAPLAAFELTFQSLEASLNQ